MSDWDDDFRSSSRGHGGLGDERVARRRERVRGRGGGTGGGSNPGRSRAVRAMRRTSGGWVEGSSLGSDERRG